LSWGVEGTEDADGAPTVQEVYAVSAAHVARQAGAITINTENSVDIVEVGPSEWLYSVDYDVALYSFPIDDIHHGKYITQGMVRSRESMADLNVGVGDDVFMIGRFINKEGKRRNTPVARFGAIAMMPNPEDPVGFEVGMPQPAFLVECRSIGGFSGAPVFVDFSGRHIDELIGSNGLPDAVLLGVDLGHLSYPQGIPSGPRQMWSAGLAVVLPVWHLRDLLLSSEAVEQRKETLVKYNEVQRRRKLADPDSSAEGLS
jgi:hypothetical protein